VKVPDVRSAIALIPLLGCAAPPAPALVPAPAPTSSQPAPTVFVPRVPRKWCHGLKPPAVVGAPHVIDVGPDDVRAIVAKMNERTDMPVMSISQRNGFVQALTECCPTRYADDCATLIVRFDKQNGVWTAVGSRELPGE
jgi:hypothetical protein